MVWAPELPFAAVQAFAAADPATDHVQTMWNCFVVATVEAVIVGMVHVAGDRVEDLHVDYGAWDAGVGSQLMEHAECEIGKHHATARLEVRAFNKRAIVFYQHRGWFEFNRYPGYECGSPIENIEMHKLLGRPSGAPASPAT